MRGSYFDPTRDDFNRTCTLSCRDSIDNFLLGLIKSCSSSGDGAPRDIGFGNTGVYEPDADPVHVVGWILQYIPLRNPVRAILKDNTAPSYQGQRTMSFFAATNATSSFIRMRIISPERTGGSTTMF